MHDATGSVTTPGYCVVQGVHREMGLHPVADREAHDPAGEHVLDGAEVELALVGPVLGGGTSRSSSGYFLGAAMLLILP